MRGTLDTSGKVFNTGLEEVLTMKHMQRNFAQRGLVRPQQGRVVAGVCAGLGQRFGFGPWTTRVLFALLLMVVPGSQLLIYPILWVLMPSEE